MTVKLLTEHHLEFLSLKEGCKGSYESALVEIPHCWKSHVVAHVKVTVQSHYNTSHYNTELDITWSCFGSQFFLQENFTKELNRKMREFYKGIIGK